MANPVNKRNAIHYENMSISLAESLANAGEGFIYEMALETVVQVLIPTGIITYLTQSTGTNASLYNQTFIKVVDDRSVNNTDARNKIESRHVSGTNYTDILDLACWIMENPTGQDAIDNALNADSLYVFDELGLVSYNASGTGQGRLLTHVIFIGTEKFKQTCANRLYS